MRNRLSRHLAIALAAYGTTLGSTAFAASDASSVNVQVQILPFASLVFLNSPLLYLEVPPPGSTAPSNGVFFTVIGNARATLTAEPDAFLNVPVEGYLGKAVLNGNGIGYKLDLRFPRTGSAGPP